MKTNIIAAFAVLATFIGGQGVAHHSGSMFEKDKTVTLTGVVKEFQYTNPHSWLIVDVTGADGKVVTWGFEAEGPSTLGRAGINKSDFATGTKVTITARPMRDGRPAGFWVKAIRLTDNKEFLPSAGFATATR